MDSKARHPDPAAGTPIPPAPANKRQAVVETLCGIPELASLGVTILQALVDAARSIRIPAGSHLFLQGESYQGRVYCLLSGLISMIRDNGEQVTIRPGGFSGLANYLDNSPYHSSAWALNDAEVLEIPAQSLRQLEQQHPALFDLLNRVIANKLRQHRSARGVNRGILAQPVSHIMRSPLATCDADTTLKQAFDLMLERKVGSLVVTGPKNSVPGLLTCSTLAETFIHNDSRPQDSIMEAACVTPLSVAPDTPIWLAEELQQRKGSKYILVCNGDQAVGMVSQTDILRALISERNASTVEIRSAGTIEQLAHLHSGLGRVAAEAYDSHRHASGAIRELSETHLAIQHRAVELTLQSMLTDKGPVPCAFAVLAMGSVGRKEALLNPDQDNAIVIANDDILERADSHAWFATFAERITHNLAHIGYPLCPGDVMASNAQFRKTLEDWKQQISHIVHNPTHKAGQWSNVVFDFATLYGDDSLTSELRSHALDSVHKQALLLRRMAEHDAQGRPALGLFNQLIPTIRSPEGERIDLKRNGLRIVADGTRIMALRAGISAQNTIERLYGLIRTGALADDFASNTIEAYEELLDLLLEHQIAQSSRGEIVDSLIDPSVLSDQTRTSLLMAMRAIRRFQSHIHEEFDTSIF